MNIFVTNEDPCLSAYCLPDKHVVKMPLECCQMLSVVYSKWYHNYGDLIKSDGTTYKTDKGAFRNHPCTKWVAESSHNIQWLIQHGITLCEEYTYRYNKIHSCEFTLQTAGFMHTYGCPDDHTPFVRAMPDEYKLDNTISTFDAYKMYIASKPWASSNYLKRPERRPEWLDPMPVRDLHNQVSWVLKTPAIITR